MSEGDTEISSSWQPTDFSTLTAPAVKERPPRSIATRLLLSRLPIIVLAFAYVFDFLLNQLPEFTGVPALTRIGAEASVLVWATLPGLNGAGASGAAGFFMLLAILGAIALVVLGRRPVVPLAALAAATLVVAGIAIRLIQVLGQSWSPVPVAGLLFGVLIAVTAIFAAREIVLTDPAHGRSGSGGRAKWRATPGLFLIALTWLGAVAIGRYFEPALVAAIRAAAPSERWHYLGDKSSWWLYLLGMLVVLIGYAIAQLLPPWSGRAKQIVTAAILIIASVVAIQQAHPYVHRAASHVVQFGPSGH